MKMLTLATGVLAAGSSMAGATAAVAATTPAHEADVDSAFALPAGTASPGQVKAAMQRLGMSVLDTPVTTLLSGEQRVAASERESIVECNGNYCIWVKPQISSKVSANGAHESRQLLERVQNAGPTSLASLLNEMDRVVKPGEPWSVARGANGSYFVG